MDLAVERQHQHHGVFRHGMRRISGNTHDGMPYSAAAFGSTLLNPAQRRAIRLHVHRRQRAYRGGIGRIVHEDTDRIGPCASEVLLPFRWLRW